MRFSLPTWTALTTPSRISRYKPLCDILSSSAVCLTVWNCGLVCPVSAHCIFTTSCLSARSPRSVPARLKPEHHVEAHSGAFRSIIRLSGSLLIPFLLFSRIYFLYQTVLNRSTHIFTLRPSYKIAFKDNSIVYDRLAVFFTSQVRKFYLLHLQLLNGCNETAFLHPYTKGSPT